MHPSAFTQGIDHGGLTTDFEVKILLCCLVGHLKKPVTKEELNKILMATELVNYFEAADACSELQSTGQLLLNSRDGSLSLSPLGEKTVEEFEKSLPLSVREKCYAAADEYVLQRRRKEEIFIDYHQAPDGYQFTVIMKDYGTDLIDLTLFLPTEQECKAIRHRIYEEPSHIYKGLLAVLTGSSGELEEYIKEQQGKQ